MKSFEVTVKMKASEQCFPVVLLFITLYKMVKVLSDYSNESYGVVISCGAVYYVVEGGANF